MPMTREMVIRDCKSAILAGELGIAIARLTIFCQDAARAECPTYNNTKGMDHALKLQHVIKGLDTMIATAQSFREELSKGNSTGQADGVPEQQGFHGVP